MKLPMEHISECDEELPRQQRRRLEREQQRAWAASYRRRKRWQGAYLDADDLLPFFADVSTADVVRDVVDTCLKEILRGAPIPKKGFAIGVRIGYVLDGKRLIFAPAGLRRCSPGQNSHIAVIGFLDAGDAGICKLQTSWVDTPEIALSNFMNAATTELRLPFTLVRDPKLAKKPYGTCWLYQIRFNTEQAIRNGLLNEQTFEMLGHGYFGVTRRPFAVRVTEHFLTMKAGEGHLLHTVWRDLEHHKMPHRLIAQLVAHSTSEDEIYALEEQVVAEFTLAPRGLNMIPGGRAGIQFLRRLGIATAGFDNRDQLLARAIKAGRAGAAPHYRSAHLREYKLGAYTMVSGHWVNANTSSSTQP